MKSRVTIFPSIILASFLSCKSTTVAPADKPKPAQNTKPKEEDPPEGPPVENPKSCLSRAIPQRLQWPVPSRRQVTQDYGAFIQYQDCRFHTGIDVNAPDGSPIVAAEAGLVVHVGPMWYSEVGKGRGPYAVIIEHVSGEYYTTYSHNRRALVQKGQCVNKGQMIAEVGNLGYSSGPHLHFEIVKGKRFTNNWKEPFDDPCVVSKPYDPYSGYRSTNAKDVIYDY